MADIKTKESLHTVKFFDRVQNLAMKTREGVEEAKQGIGDTVNSSDNDASDYGANRLQEFEGSLAVFTAYAAKETGEWGLRETEKNIRRIRNNRKINHTATPKSVKNPIKTAQNTKETARTAEKTAKASKAAAKTAKEAVKATAEFIKEAGKAIVATVKAAVAAIKGLIAAIAAGGWISVVIIVVIVLIGGLVAATCEIFVPDENGGYSVVYMMNACESEYGGKEAEIVNTVPHDYLVIHGEEADMKDIIAVYAVKSKATGDKLLVADEKNQEIFREVFDYMYSISYHRSEIIEFVKVEKVDESGNTSYVIEEVPRIILTIERKTKSAYRAAEHFEFKKQQMQYLDTLMDSDFDEMWTALVD